MPEENNNGQKVSGQSNASWIKYNMQNLNCGASNCLCVAGGITIFYNISCRFFSPTLKCGGGPVILPQSLEANKHHQEKNLPSKVWHTHTSKHCMIFFAILFLTFLCDIIDILTNFGLTKYIKSAKNVCNAVILCWGYDTSMPDLKWYDLRFNGHVIILPVKLISLSQLISC